MKLIVYQNGELGFLSHDAFYTTKGIYFNGCYQEVKAKEFVNVPALAKAVVDMISAKCNDAWEQFYQESDPVIRFGVDKLTAAKSELVDLTVEDIIQQARA